MGKLVLVSFNIRLSTVLNDLEVHQHPPLQQWECERLVKLRNDGRQTVVGFIMG
jgi:hypothetical protein